MKRKQHSIQDEDESIQLSSFSDNSSMYKDRYDR